MIFLVISGPWRQTSVNLFIILFRNAFNVFLTYHSPSFPSSSNPWHLSSSWSTLCNLGYAQQPSKKRDIYQDNSTQELLYRPYYPSSWSSSRYLFSDVQPYPVSQRFQRDLRRKSSSHLFFLLVQLPLNIFGIRLPDRFIQLLLRLDVYQQASLVFVWLLQGYLWRYLSILLYLFERFCDV